MPRRRSFPDRRLEAIKATQDDCLIIAAEIVSGRPQEAGIRVDIAVTLDRHMSGWFDADLSQETVIAGNLNAVPDIMAKYPQRLYILPDATAQRYGLPDNHVMMGSNVGVSLISLANKLDVAEIIVGGLDLATEGNYYSQFVENVERKTADIYQRVAGLDARVPGNYGCDLATNTYFATFDQ